MGAATQVGGAAIQGDINSWTDVGVNAGVGFLTGAIGGAIGGAQNSAANISRQSMARYGFSPATRVFEAAGAGAEAERVFSLMGRQPSLFVAALKALAERNINIRAITTSEIKFSVLIDTAYTELAVRTLHTLYGLDQV